MAKKIVPFRLSENTLKEIDMLVVTLSDKTNIKLDRTKVIEMLIAKGYQLELSENNRVSN